MKIPRRFLCGTIRFNPAHCILVASHQQIARANHPRQLRHPREPAGIRGAGRSFNSAHSSLTRRNGRASRSFPLTRGIRRALVPSAVASINAIVPRKVNSPVCPVDASRLDSQITSRLATHLHRTQVQGVASRAVVNPPNVAHDTCTARKCRCEAKAVGMYSVPIELRSSAVTSHPVLLGV